VGVKAWRNSWWQQTPGGPYVPNPYTWTQRASPADIAYRCVVWCAEISRFCAVASSGTGAGRAAISPDGVNWTLATTSTTSSWFSVVWCLGVGAGVGRIVAIGTNGTGPGNALRCMTSDDAGVTWVTRATPATNITWQAVVWLPGVGAGVGRLVACSNSGAGTQNVMTSDDGGVTWTLRTTPVQLGWTALAYSPTLGSGLGRVVCCVGGSSAATNRIMYSDDGGVTWSVSSVPTTTTANTTPIWVAELALFVAAGSGVNQLISTDGITWTTNAVGFATTGACWAREIGLLVSAGRNTGFPNYSRDGLRWDRWPSDGFTTKFYDSTCWSPQLGIFCSCSTIGTSPLFLTGARS
jgi:hypothetical protein